MVIIMEDKNRQFPFNRPLPLKTNVDKEEAKRGEDSEETSLSREGASEKSHDMLFGILGGFSLILAIVSFVLMFVL